MDDGKTTARITNNKVRTTFRLEPHGRRYVIAAGESLEIRSWGADLEPVEFVIDDEFEVWVPPASDVFRDGEMVDPAPS